MSRVKLYSLKTDEVAMEVDPVDAKEILASKDCGVSTMTKAERAEAAKQAKATKAEK